MKTIFRASKKYLEAPSKEKGKSTEKKQKDQQWKWSSKILIKLFPMLEELRNNTKEIKLKEDMKRKEAKWSFELFFKAHFADIKNIEDKLEKKTEKEKRKNNIVIREMEGNREKTEEIVETFLKGTEIDRKVIRANNGRK